MDGVVTFDPQQFTTIYPQFANLSAEVLQNYFDMACLLCDNTTKSPVKNLQERATLLYLLTCHIATLKQNGTDMTVGILTAATEGKVNISLTPFADANWYMTTKCGMMYWQATAKYRVGIRYNAWRPC